MSINCVFKHESVKFVIFNKATTGLSVSKARQLVYIGFIIFLCACVSYSCSKRYQLALRHQRKVNSVYEETILENQKPGTASKTLKSIANDPTLQDGYFNVTTGTSSQETKKNAWLKLFTSDRMMYASLKFLPHYIINEFSLSIHNARF